MGNQGGCSVMELLHNTGLLVVALNLAAVVDLMMPVLARELFQVAGLLVVALNLALALAPLSLLDLSSLA